eukprot:TRINITY_DN7719_c0_g1_i2.p1 TRINITY_DN7719_c0_g1~~TRINITY_DN7719_c0_g1_i2.p1  ORF type:complete len:375 (+),score=22.05 TRINITY_DN7719_c0_g1_i2:830-1954(+)
MSYNNFTSISSQTLVSVTFFMAHHNQLSGALPDFILPQVLKINLSFNNIFGPLPPWDTLSRLNQLILSPNPELSGPLPSSMDQYYGLVELDVLRTSLMRNSSLLCPSIFVFTEKYQLLSIRDKFQCPVLANSNQMYSNILIPPSYYQYYNCRCLPGTVGYRGRCLPCPEECHCDDGFTLGGCYPSPSLEMITHLIPCVNKYACNLTLSSTIITNVSAITDEFRVCTAGHAGRLCSRCESRYGAQGRSCVKCQDATVYVSMVLLPIMVIGFMVYLYKSKPSSSGKVRIILFHLQSISVVAAVMSTTRSVNRFANLSTSIGSMQLPNFSCFLGTTSAFEPLLYNVARVPLLAVFFYSLPAVNTRRSERQGKKALID